MFSLTELDNTTKYPVARVQTVDNKKKVKVSIVWFYPDMDPEQDKSRDFSDIIEFQNAVVSLLPRKDRSIVYVAGKNGVGKSTWMANYAINYNYMFPKNSIYLITTIENDPAFDKYKFIKRLKISELVEDPIEDIEKELPNCLVIFDDLETLPKKDLEVINRFRDKLLTCGRHSNTSVGLLYHSLFDGTKSRLMISEQDVTTFFPQSNAYQPAQFMRKYCGLDPKQIKNISSIKSRWTTFVNSYYKPFIVYEHGLALVESLH